MLLPRALAFSLALIAAPLTAQDEAPTRIMSQTDAERLRTVQGITLQWIDWDRRGDVSVSEDANGVWRIEGEQLDESGAGVRVSGVITEIGKDYFLLDGTVAIADTPDVGRACSATKVWRFGATQRRSYYRLREFEWCDYLTDYVDIYFAPGLR
ncbi:MAG: hypothetical protein CL955_00260 [Erythrobacteraceae bacterium]|nr:hypothetical protein [Erythrobacteraceae bacterium]|tara:strand:- start:98 stop:559 length:462 start_codon:yes stop_codon:yes gene_type:complete